MGPEAGCLRLAPGVLLLHGFDAGPGPLALRWVQLAHRPPLGPGGEPVETAFALVLPAPLSGRALQAVGRLVACLEDAELRFAAAAAPSRDALLHALARVEPLAGERTLEAAEVCALLATEAGGLAAAEAARRRGVCGANEIERVRRRPLALRFLAEFTSFFAVLLWAGSVLALAAGLPELAAAIVAVIVVNGVFSFLQEYRAERAVEALQRLLPRAVRVLRDGGETPLAVADLVPGDVVRLEEGDQVPADAQLLAAEALRVDQSALTGESHPVAKRPALGRERREDAGPSRPEQLFAGTSVVAGSATCVVRSTGMSTQIGDVARLTQAVPEEPSPLQQEMRRVTRVVTAIAVGVGVGFFALGVATGAMPPGQGFAFALGVIVANVPEGLLPTLTLALALGVQRLARERSLMRRLSGVETLGATTVICTDKTGTLTENRMAARLAFASGRSRELGAAAAAADPELRALLAAATLASQATPEHGDPTEVALVVGCARLGAEPGALRAARPLLASHPFDSFRKRMTLVRGGEEGPVAFVKGAPRETLALCDAIRWEDTELPLDEARRRSVLAEHERLARSGYRVLAVASRRLAPAGVGAPTTEVERRLTFLGLVALWDPPRPEVPEAIASCQRAGIRVLVVTGDDPLTARAIAERIGLPVGPVVTGSEIDRATPGGLEALLARPGLLFARTSPAHKLAIVSALERMGEVVAATGDGVNDAPALRAATIGVAMGGRGSDVAKEAADMVITDDDFASIVSAIRLGRAAWANMGKFVTYIFASNVPELVPFLAFVFLGIPLPLTVMQILAVDLGTDLLPALALGAEAPEPGVMERPPRPRRERLLGAGRLLRAYAFLGVVEAALALAAFFWTYHVAGWQPGEPMAAEGALYRRATTMTLAGIVAAQVGNVLACRTDRESVFRVGLLRNRGVWLGIAAAIGVLLALIGTPPLSRVFGLAPLRFAEWWLLLLFPGVVLLCEEARKAVVRGLEARRGRGVG
jgi:calcium-translocating P-type ATPase